MPLSASRIGLVVPQISTVGAWLPLTWRTLKIHRNVPTWWLSSTQPRLVPLPWVAPPVTVHAPAACGVHPSRLVPLSMEPRFGSPYGFDGGGPAGVCTASASLGGETLPAASAAV